MNKKTSTRIKKILANIYLYGAYAAIFYNFAYHLDYRCPIGIFVAVVETLGYFIAYILLNHLLIKRVVPHKILRTIELLLLLSLFLVFLSGAISYGGFHLYNEMLR